MPEGGAERLIAFVVNRAHHADIGAAAPGSMPLSTTLADEGVVIPPTLLLRAGEVDEAVFERITAQSRNATQCRGDYAAQISANHCGIRRLQALLEHQGSAGFRAGLVALNDYAERLALNSLRTIPDGVYDFHDLMDDDGMGQRDILIQVRITVSRGQVHVDFSGTASQVAGNINCPLSVAAAAVYYVFRCLMPRHTPQTSAVFHPIQIIAPKGCLLHAGQGAAVAAGNVETSQRIVDVVLGALAKAMPDRIPAAAQGTMNNVIFGGDDVQGHDWLYYETLAGGMGAHASGDGLSAVQCHMTNTKNSSIEVLEMHYPLQIREYAVRQDSGGRGLYRGGDGLIREWFIRRDCSVSLLTERRTTPPYGLQGGGAGSTGKNRLCRDGEWQELAAKGSWQLKAGDIIRIETPGGGGFAKASDQY